MKRGRPPLIKKSHRCFVTVPYEVDLKLKDYCQKSKLCISQVLLQALKEFLINK